MTTSLVAALVTAGVLGFTHALEPDHVAGISSLTGEYGDSKLSAIAGACFSAGHVALVVLWVIIAYALVGRTSFPATFHVVGTVGVGVLLGLLGGAMALTGLRAVMRTGEHSHGDKTHSHPHVQPPLPGLDGHDHGTTTRAYLETGLVGALFTLSPPVSMIVFTSTLLPELGVETVGLAVLTYAVAITVTMSLLGAGAGVLFARTRTRGERVHAATQVLAGALVFLLATSMLVDAAATL
ncbi:hypothetical protein [Haloarchaeobius salinus]|uniref:hypothetical protein n=1 Tax=Haloarchaeobius salinus TaxID=1198298 RepID=UPI00210C2C65|nr:hypothetical protein [Haloarchaeobius salinus]